MRTPRAFVLLALAAALAACAGDSVDDNGLDPVLRYFPAERSGVALLSTNLESEQFARFDRIVRKRSGESVETMLREFVEDDLELSWEDDIEPLLGRDMALGSFRVGRDGGFLVVLRVPEGDDLDDVVERRDRFSSTGEAEGARLYTDRETRLHVGVDGDMLLLAQDAATLRDAVERKDSADRLTEEQFDEALADLPAGAPLRVFTDAELVLTSSRIAPFRGLRWLDALRTLGVAVSFAEGGALVDFALNTDADRLEEQDLPLATGRAAPEVLRRDGQIVGGNRNQSLTTAFLFRAAEAAFPDSRFVRDVHRLERELGIDFVAEVLRQFDGPSASAVSPDGATFAARSALRDPEGLRMLLPRLAPHLPRLVEGLEALGSEGQALLFLVAPDALVLRSERVRVDRVGELWRVRGLEGESPDQLYFGVLGDVFVVASEPGLARRVAREETVALEGARGAGVVRAELIGREDELERLLQLDLDDLGAVVAWLEASEERLRGRVSAELP